MAAPAHRRAERGRWASPGQGLRDMTRIAASDPELWVQILGANATPVRDMLRALPRRPRPVHRRARRARPRPARAARVAEELAGGNAGVARLPGKHGTTKPLHDRSSSWSTTRPGELARLLTEIGEIGVNLEDLRLEHSPGAPGRARRDRRAARGGRATHRRAGRARLADRRLNVSRDRPRRRRHRRPRRQRQVERQSKAVAPRARLRVPRHGRRLPRARLARSRHRGIDTG